MKADLGSESTRRTIQDEEIAKNFLQPWSATLNSSLQAAIKSRQNVKAARWVAIPLLLRESAADPTFIAQDLPRCSEGNPQERYWWTPSGAGQAGGYVSVFSVFEVSS